MIEKIVISGSITQTAACKISAICRPLLQLDIPYFRYGKLFNDGSRIILSNKPEVSQFCYEEGYYPFTWYDNDKPLSTYQEGYKLWAIERSLDDSKQTQVGIEIKKLFHLTDGVSYLKRHKNFLEIFDFSSKSPEMYRTDPKTLLHFMYYFKEQAKKLITGAESEKILVPLQSTMAINSTREKKESQFIRETSIKRYYISDAYGDTYFTKREIDCLNWCVKGKTAEEIGLLLGVTKKTVEKHLEAIKKKANCYKQIQLTMFAIKHGLMNK